MIEWTQTAVDDLVGIKQAGKEASQSIVKRLFTTADRLEVFPHSGRLGFLPDTREFVIADLPYFLVYRVADNVEILRVMHTSRLWVGD